VKHTQTMGTEREGAMLNKQAGKPAKDLSGTRIGSLTVVRPAPSLGNGTRWLCACDCGAPEYRLGQQLRQAVKLGQSPACAACITKRKVGK
jgi:hypothetical protein